MDLKDILAISGQSGLFRIVSQAKNSIIVENLETKKRIPAYATHKISALDDIAIFTVEDDIKLSEVFDLIYKHEDAGESLNSKKASSKEIKDYFEEILPNFDKERVYVSDIKKVFQWYNLLHKLDLLKPEEKEESKTEENNESENPEITDSQEK